MAFGKFLAPLNGHTLQQQIEKPYVDDIFDPIFNRNVTSYYRNLYGTLGAIPAGYAAMLENALAGNNGILGPGMGILSTFGRSMDKADDFILGGLTEGVNLVGRGLGGLNEAPQNPFERIFVDDYNYEGTGLLAAMGNAMGRLAGVQTPLDETDFQSFGDKILGTGIELATDPGILGGSLAKLNPSTPVGEMGRFLDKYDNVMAEISGNMAFPGGKALLGKGLNLIKTKLDTGSSADYIDAVIRRQVNDGNPLMGIDDSTLKNSNFSDAAIAEYKNMADDLVNNYTYSTGKELDLIEDADLKALIEYIDSRTLPVLEKEAFKKHIKQQQLEQQKMLAAMDYTLNNMSYGGVASKDLVDQTLVNKTKDKLKHDTKVAELKNLSQKTRNENIESAVAMAKDPKLMHLFQAGKKHSGAVDETISNAIESANSPDDLIDVIETYFVDPKKETATSRGSEIADRYIDKYLAEGDIPFIEIKQKLLNEIADKPQYTKKASAITFSGNKKGFNSIIASNVLDVVEYNLRNFFEKHPTKFTTKDGEDVYKMFKTAGNTEYIPGESLTNLYNFVNGRPFNKATEAKDLKVSKNTKTKSKDTKVKDTKTNTKYPNPTDFKDESIYDGKDYDKILHMLFHVPADNQITRDMGIVPWVERHYDELVKFREGRDLIELADSLKKEVGDVIDYDMVDVKHIDETSKHTYNNQLLNEEGEYENFAESRAFVEDPEVIDVADESFDNKMQRLSTLAAKRKRVADILYDIEQNNVQDVVQVREARKLLKKYEDKEIKFLQKIFDQYFPGRQASLKELDTLEQFFITSGTLETTNFDTADVLKEFEKDFPEVKTLYEKNNSDAPEVAEFKDKGLLQASEKEVLYSPVQELNRKLTIAEEDLTPEILHYIAEKYPQFDIFTSNSYKMAQPEYNLEIDKTLKTLKDFQSEYATYKNEVLTYNSQLKKYHELQAHNKTLKDLKKAETTESLETINGISPKERSAKIEELEKKTIPMLKKELKNYNPDYLQYLDNRRKHIKNVFDKDIKKHFTATDGKSFTMDILNNKIKDVEDQINSLKRAPTKLDNLIYEHFTLYKTQMAREKALISATVNSWDDLIKKSNGIENLPSDQINFYTELKNLEKNYSVDAFNDFAIKYPDKIVVPGKDEPAFKYYYDTLKVKPVNISETLYKQNVYNTKEAARLKTAKAQYLEGSYNNIKEIAEATEMLKQTSPEDFSNMVVKSAFPEDASKTWGNRLLTIEEYTKYKAIEGEYKQFAAKFGLPDSIEYYDTVKKTVIKFGSNDDKRLFSMIEAASGVPNANKNKVKGVPNTNHGALASDLVTESRQKMSNLDRKHASDSTWKAKKAEYLSWRDEKTPIILKGKGLLESIYASRGFKEIPLDRKLSIDEQNNIIAQIKHNVNVVNKNHGQILKVTDAIIDGQRRVAVMFDFENINIKKDIHRIYSLFGSKSLGIEDIVIRNGNTNKLAWDTSELDEALGSTRIASEAAAYKMGQQSFDPNYYAHVVKNTKEAGMYFTTLQNKLGIDTESLEKICNALYAEDIAKNKGIFGNIIPERSYLGSFGQYKDCFSDDLAEIHTATFSQGIFEDTYVNTFFELFYTDNFKVTKQFESLATLKNALLLKDANGKLSGNFYNLELVSPKYKDGRLVGFKKYDKLSDVDLNLAWKNDAILIPSNTIAPLDRILKRNTRLNNSKILKFINKYITIPFKFGTLSNIGFLLGNFTDAYFKQAVELSKKHGTSLPEEIANVAMSMRQVVTLNNQVTDIFDDYRDFLKNVDLSIKDNAKLKPIYQHSKHLGKELTIDMVLTNPELRRSFYTYLANNRTAQEAGAARFYIFLNNQQNTKLFSDNTLDLEDVKSMVTDNEYNVPNNFVDRLFYGNPSAETFKDKKGNTYYTKRKGFNAWGMFLNNPISTGILNASTGTENWMRSAAILNELSHNGYSFDKICDMLGLDQVSEKAVRSKLIMDTQNAVNTMYAANFNYDRVSDLMNKASYILPFPTFYLKNLAYWIEMAVEKPQLIDNIISTHEAMWAGSNPEDDEFEKEAKGRGAIPIGQQDTPLTKHLTGFVKQTPYSSMFGAFNSINNFKDDFAYRINPAARMVTRHLQDSEDVKYRPYNTDQYQKNIKSTDREFSDLAYLFHQLNPYEKYMNTYLRTPGKIAKGEAQLSDFVPHVFQPNFKNKK